MLFAYVYCFGPQMEAPELCIVPSKPDTFSCAVRVSSLIETKSAIIRLSLSEGIKVRGDEKDGGLIVEPIVPSKLYITPSQPDRPGVHVKAIKADKNADGTWNTYFKEEGREMDWKPWRPNEVS